jgi:hypothetical protein
MPRAKNSSGFTIVELVLACVIFPLVVVGIATSYNAVRRAYMTARQMNEMYAVLSACPELDRALEFNSLSAGTNCYPNNTFQVEDSNTIGKNVYTPALTVSNTSSLDSGDPLKGIPDSKVVNIEVGFPKPNTSNKPLQLRILITRNGIGQQ